MVAGLTFCLIVVGALVRANDAGLACPDWPLCYGEFVPTFDLKVAFEWGHRVFALTGEQKKLWRILLPSGYWVYTRSPGLITGALGEPSPSHIFCVRLRANTHQG